MKGDWACYASALSFGGKQQAGTETFECRKATAGAWKGITSSFKTVGGEKMHHRENKDCSHTRRVKVK